MTSNPHITQPARAPDPDDLQRRAADPGQSVWVAASAGSGKTKVLTDRVLRLLLPRADGRPGTPPERILCLTFTKAGAAEMAVRINNAMASWAVQDEESLYSGLSGLLGRTPTPQEAEAARQLFARVIDSPGGLKILTIHSFCQSILGRFPVEAGLSPHFSVADDRAVLPLQQMAMTNLLLQAGETPGGVIAQAITRLSQEQGEDDMANLLRAVMAERTRLYFMLRRYGDFGRIEAALYNHLDLSPGDTPTRMIRAAFANDQFDEPGLRSCCSVMAASDKPSTRERADEIQRFLDARAMNPDSAWDETYRVYRGAFLKDKLSKPGEEWIYSRLTTKDVDTAMPDAADILRWEAERLLGLDDRLKALGCAAMTRDILALGLEMLRLYTAEKRRLALLDYDDLIGYTLDLLSGKTMGTGQRDASAWVRYKLDQGIDHILVDEAQDTNPEQWDIIHALTDEFFAEDTDRSIFAVGDDKQSIFGFQRAAPEKFREAQHFYESRARQAGRAFESVDMFVSFRSVDAVLSMTDVVFSGEDGAMALGLPPGNQVQHISHRAGQAGRVELWPMIETTPPEPPAPWAPPTQIEHTENAESVLARRIAANIAGWIRDGEILPAYNRAVRAGDIMILVRTRGTMVDHLVRALKSCGVPVSGADRMVLKSQIAVQDMLAAAQFALQPDDDLSLACLLKSPLIGLDEDGLYKIAAGRGGQSLWSAAKQVLAAETTLWLNGLMSRAGMVHPYEFFSAILHHPCPADPGGSGMRGMLRRLGEDAVDPLQEFLNSTLQFEQDNIPSLQQFLHWQREGESQIKREMEGAGDKVRIMTVHASKGLQAPIVILPDTAHTEASITKINTAERLLWVQQKDGLPLPLWSPRKDDDCAVYNDALTRRKQGLRAEYNRLFYVALTRAADRLYVAGCSKSTRNKPAPACWYAQAEQALARLPGATSVVLSAGDELPGFRLDTPQVTAPDRAPKTKTDAKTASSATAWQPDNWDWVTQPPPEEDNPPRPWSPSRPSDPDTALRSPLDAGDDGYRFRRGNITHTLLQFLPGLPEGRRRDAARKWIAQQDISPAIAEDVMRETFAILEHPDYTALFGPGSMAEVPITGLIGQKLVSGQIDRLLVTPQDIRIVDYKTNRPPPRDPADVPALYRTQMKAYRDTLSRIYADRPIRTFLLWTDGPRIMEIE